MPQMPEPPQQVEMPLIPVFGSGDRLPAERGSTTTTIESFYDDDVEMPQKPVEATLEGGDGDDPTTEMPLADDDGEEPITEPEPTLVASETVDRPSINYSYSSEFHGINPYDFMAIWEGPIEIVGSEWQIVNAEFGFSSADVVLYVDDELVQEFASSKVVPLRLEEGLHSLKIEYHNNYDSTIFAASFESYPDIQVSTAQEFLVPLIDDDTNIIYVGTVRSGSTFNEVSVEIASEKFNDSPCFLFLASTDPVHWDVQSNRCPVAGIAVDARRPAFTVVVSNSHRDGDSSSTSSIVPIYHITDMADTWSKDAELPTVGIPQMLNNKTVDYQHYGYTLTYIQL